MADGVRRVRRCLENPGTFGNVELLFRYLIGSLVTQAGFSAEVRNLQEKLGAENVLDVFPMKLFHLAYLVLLLVP